MARNKFPSYTARFASALQKIREGYKIPSPRPLPTPLFRAGTACTALSSTNGYLFFSALGFLQFTFEHVEVDDFKNHIGLWHPSTLVRGTS